MALIKLVRLWFTHKYMLFMFGNGSFEESFYYVELDQLKRKLKGGR